MNTIQSKALVGMGSVGEVPILLVKPPAYMNFSGESVGPLAAYYNIPLRHILMVYDDMGLPNGVLRLQPKGGHSHHNGQELMEGLEDVSPLRSPNHLRSFSFDVVRIQPSHDDGDCCAAPFDRPKSRFHENVKFNSRVDDLDPPERVSTFRKSLQELPTEHPFHIRIPEMKTNPQFESWDEEKEEEEEGNCKRKTLGKEKVILHKP